MPDRRTHRVARAPVVALVWATVIPVLAATPAIPTRSSSEARLLADAQDGRLDRHSLIAAALVAGGSSDASLARDCEARLEALAEEFRASEDFDLPMVARAEAMHRFLHDRVLMGDYDGSVNSVGDMFHHGSFNCITASTLLIALAERLGVEAVACEAPAHVLVVVDPQGVAAVVEMTRRPPAVQSLAANAPADESRPRPPGRLIRATQLLATYYHNRGVERLAARDYAAAVALNQTALELDRDCGAAKQNLLAAWNNWALTLADSGDFAQALEKIDAGLAIAPDYAPLRENRTLIEHRRTATAPGPRSALRRGAIASKFY